MLLTPRSVAISLALLLGVAHWLQAQAVPAPTPVGGNFQTVYGKEYKDTTVSRVEPDGIVLRTKSGISKVYFVELPKGVQERFHYDAAKAAQFTIVEQAAVARLNSATAAQQQQQAEERQRQAAALAQKRQQAEEQQRLAAERQARIEPQHAANRRAVENSTRKPSAGAQHETSTAGAPNPVSSYTYGDGNHIDVRQAWGNARVGGYHTYSATRGGPNVPSSSGSTETSWGPAPKR